MVTIPMIHGMPFARGSMSEAPTPLRAYVSLVNLIKCAWDKGMIQVTDHHDDEVAAQIAEEIGYFYERKWP